MFDPKTRVLIVDDFESMRLMTVNVFRELGFEDLIQAEDGDKGWAALETSTPPIGLIISDWNMPNCNGLEFLKKVRADERFKKLPFILATTESEKDNILEALKHSVSNFVTKPFTKEVFQKKLESVHAKIMGPGKAPK